MMIRFSSTALFLVCLGTASFAQDPLTTLPGAYTLELENDYAKVVRVHYDAGAKLADHTHPGGTTLYIYLNDSDGVVFSHSSGSGRSVTRPPVKAGAMRVSSGVEEHHAVENTAKTASDFLRVYFKTQDGGGRNMRRIAPGENEFSSKQMRITRTTVSPGQKTLVEAKDKPALRVAVATGTTAWKIPPKDAVRWLDAGTTEEFAVTGDNPVDVIRIDFLTKPK